MESEQFEDLIERLEGNRKQWNDVLKERLSQRQQADAEEESDEDEQKSAEETEKPVHQIGGGNYRLYSLVPVRPYKHKLWKCNNFCEKCMQVVAAGYDRIQCTSCNIVLHRDCMDESKLSLDGRFMCDECRLGVVEHKSHAQRKRGEESLKIRVLAGILRMQASYRMRSKRKAYDRVRNGVLRLQACFRRKRMNDTVLRELLNTRFPIKIRVHNIQVVRSNDSNTHEEAWLPSRPEEMPLGTPLYGVAARLELAREHLYIGDQVHRHTTTSWFNDAVAHPPPEDFPEQSYALTIAVFEPHDMSDAKQHEIHQVFRMDIPLVVGHSRICFDGSEVVTLTPKKHTVLLPSALASSQIVCTLAEVHTYPRARFIGQAAFDLSNYAPWHQCVLVRQECGPPKHDVLPDLESRITYWSNSERSLLATSPKQQTKVATARKNMVTFAALPSSSMTCKAGPAFELSSQRVAVAVRRKVWLVVTESVLAIYNKLGDYRPKQLFGLRGTSLSYDAAQCVVTMQQSTGKLSHILLTNDVSDWLLKLGINKTPNGSDVDIESRLGQVSFAALGEL